MHHFCGIDAPSCAVKMHLGRVVCTEDQGVSRATLYKCKKQFLGGEIPCIMPKELNSRRRTERRCTDVESANAEIEKLLARIAVLEKEQAELEQRAYRLRLENALLEKAAELQKKDRGINLQTLSNHEKALLIDAMRPRYLLKELTEALNISKSSYCCQAKQIRNDDRYGSLRNKIKEIFYGADRRYGYRRIHAVLHGEEWIISEKVFRRIMKEEGLMYVLRRKSDSAPT